MRSLLKSIRTLIWRSEKLDLAWVALPILCDDVVAMPPLDPNNLSSGDLPDLCIRMHMIFDDIEHDRCEGRWINQKIFDPIDTLDSDLRHRRDNQINKWLPTISRFGQYYNLAQLSEYRISAEHFVHYRPLFDAYDVPYVL